MQTLHEQVDGLIKEAQIIADNLNPNSNNKKKSIKYIQHLIARLARRYAILYTDIGEKEKDV